MKLQGTSQAVPTCMAAPMEFDAAPAAASGSPSAPEDDGDESGGPSSTPNEWEMVCRSDGKLNLETIPAGYNFSVPLLPEASTALPFEIVRFVEFVPGDDGKHFIHHVALNMCNHNWVFFGQGDTGELRPGNWAWHKQEAEVITLTYAWKNGIPEKTTSFKRNALGWYVTNKRARACHSKVLYLLPPTNVAELEDMMITSNGAGNVE